VQKVDGNLIFSPSDLITFSDSQFDSWLDRLNCECPGVLKPDALNESHLLLQKLGNRHEELFLQRLKSDGLDVFEIATTPTLQAFEETLQAMRSGRQIIYQGVLTLGNFAGRTDFLCRREGGSRFGDYEYEVWDTKLAKKAKPYFIIQLCCYAEMLESLQGVLPQSIKIVLGNFEIKEFFTKEFIYFYKQFKESFLSFHTNFSKDAPPEDSYLGTFSRWTEFGAKYLIERDDLSLVANIRQVQIQNLKKHGILTMHDLANCQLLSVPKISAETLVNLKKQALLQIKTIEAGKTAFEFQPTVIGKGFALLPAASVNDVYFDMEGYPYADGGLEYLFGAVFESKNEITFIDWWAHNSEEEKLAFESFIDWVYDRWLVDPKMHIYHYAAYEVSALRRLASRYATRIDEVDQLLRHEVFIDLYVIVRQAMIVGEPSYSIKNIEHLYREKRGGSVSKATDSVVFYERWLESGEGRSWQESPILKSIRDYNEEDCVSTKQLVQWLRSAIKDLNSPQLSTVINESTKNALSKEKHNDHDHHNEQKASDATANAKGIRLSTILANSLIEDAASIQDAEKQRVQILLAHLLDFHEREQKPLWWQYFDRFKLSEEELADDLDCLSSLQLTDRPAQSVKRSYIFEYKFSPDQDTRIEVGDRCIFLDSFPGRSLGDELKNSNILATVYSLDRINGFVCLLLGPSLREPPVHACIVANKILSTKVLSESIYRLVSRWQCDNYLPSALSDFLFRREPKISGRAFGDRVVASPDPLAVSVAVDNMLETALCIQGPPGCGKTFTAAFAIVELLKQGKTVGINSNSHKVIEHLVRSVLEEAARSDVNLRAAKIGGSSDTNDPFSANPFDNKKDSLGPDAPKSITVDHFQNASAFFSNQSTAPEHAIEPHNYNLIAGTAWFFSDRRAENIVDYLFVDEAGQVSLANIVAMSGCAKNLVMVGDQMQLEQPIQGSHPGESGQSALQYLLQGQPTIRENFGVFLGITHRMHPLLTQVISQAVYQSRLLSASGNERQVLVLNEKLRQRSIRPAGLTWCPVLHEGNTQASTEEADFIASLVKDLASASLIDRNGQQKSIDIKRDILIVAPYNMQIRLITERIKGIQAASVDKFQGREAPIVILSMCASEGNSSPRGIKFLLDKSRLNVAISRAKIMAFIVGSPELTKADCSTIEQMQLLNFFCQLVDNGGGK
jgi:uncharacterized protein